ncbi:uncharacterized protein [Amphiura filiformis]|uniref:uncharacterized protein n=1 Tax=Amphiura filiformis TaxID=82378 RepID=UPI003B219968
MRAIVQRVTKASVTVGDELISSIGRGLCVLIGISRDDTPKERDYIARKILNLRVFDDDNGKRWNKSVKDKQLEILCVSQFTLYTIMKGNKPDFHSAMGGEESEQFYNEFLDILRKDYDPAKIKDGKFGAYMQVHIQNDGPVTIQLDSPTFVEPKTPIGDASPMKKVSSPPNRQSVCKTPVAVVKAQTHQVEKGANKSKEKASRYINTIVRAFQDTPDIRKQFTDALKKYKEATISLPELLLETASLFHGQRELLCSFTQFLPPGHSIFIVNQDPTKVRIRLASVQEPMTVAELGQYIKDTEQVTMVTPPANASGEASSSSLTESSSSTSSAGARALCLPLLEELTHQLEQISS